MAFVVFISNIFLNQSFNKAQKIKKNNFINNPKMLYRITFGN